MKPGYQADGGIIRTYRMFSWVLLRAYGAAFGYLAWTSQKWIGMEHPSFPDLLLGVPDGFVTGVLWATAAIFAIPFLTPQFIASPRLLVTAIAKAIILSIATAVLMIMCDIWLIAERATWANEARPTASLLIKTLGTVAVVSSILVGFVNQITDRKGKPYDPRLARQSDLDWAAELAAAAYSQTNKSDLREMRESRMPVKHVPIFRK